MIYDVSSESVVFYYPSWIGLLMTLIGVALLAFVIRGFITKGSGLSLKNKIRGVLVILGAVAFTWGGLFFMTYKLSISSEEISQYGFLRYNDQLKWNEVERFSYLHQDDRDPAGRPRKTEQVILGDDQGTKMEIGVSGLSDEKFQNLMNILRSNLPEERFNPEDMDQFYQLVIKRPITKQAE